MNIGLVSPRYPPTYAGGGEISAQLLVERLDARDDVDTIEVFSFDGDSTERVNGVTVHRLADVPQYPYSLPNELAYRKLRSLDLDCDLLHAYNMHLHPAVGRLSKERGVPAVATLNAYPLIDWADVGVRPSLQRRLYELTLLRIERPRLKRMMRHIDTFLPLSDAVESVYREHGFADADFEVVPNMIDPAFEVPDRTSNESDRAMLLYVGYLRPSKGVRFLVDVMELLPQTYTLKIVGDGPEREQLEVRANQNEASERITFTGAVPYEEVAQAYADADVFVHPGTWVEPFGRTILEAMQSGLPVVSTNVGGPAETVPQTELLVERGDLISLRDSIEYAYENRDRIRQENTRIVEEQYHPDVVISQFCDVYEQTLEKQ